MKCPKCGTEMAEGFLQSKHDSPISWVGTLLPVGLGALSKNAEVLTEDTGLGVNAVPAHICKACCLVICDYSHKK